MGAAFQRSGGGGGAGRGRGQPLKRTTLGFFTEWRHKSAAQLDDTWQPGPQLPACNTHTHTAAPPTFTEYMEMCVWTYVLLSWHTHLETMTFNTHTHC